MNKGISKYDFLAGATLLVNKPKGWTSFDVVNKIRYHLKKKLNVKNIKVGHAGTPAKPRKTSLIIRGWTRNIPVRFASALPPLLMMPKPNPTLLFLPNISLPKC